MLVSRGDLDAVIKILEAPGDWGLDTETTGLGEDDHLFALTIYSDRLSLYFNFQQYPGLDPCHVLERRELLRFDRAFRNPGSRWYIQNAKFDLRMLAKEGLHIAGDVHCTYAVERVLQNNHFGDKGYTLAGLAMRRGWEKDTAVEVAVSKLKLYDVKTVPGKKKKIKVPHFERVPFDIMLKYAEHDAKLHFDIGKAQELELEQSDLAWPTFPSLRALFENEKRLTKTCFRMERRGVMLDVGYTERALQYELTEIKLAKANFLASTGREYQDSRKVLQEVFDAAGEPYPLTEKGNPSFNADALEEMTSPIAGIVNKIRGHEKRAGTYYSSFLHYADSHGIIHPDMRQAGTETGRFSYRDPNLQNVPKEAEQEDEAKPFHVRQCFVPRPGHFFYSVDFRQQEFRMMLDFAGEKRLIAEINAGADVHQATADLLGITRKQAKTINFGLLYGMGQGKLAKSLGLPPAQAKELIMDYFAKLPRVKLFTSKVMATGSARGFVFNWYGRRNHVAQPNWAYILPNHIIQGGCADVIKIAMNRIDDRLLELGAKTHMLLQVHDELVFETPFAESDIIDEVVPIMESTYRPQNGMLLTTSVEHRLESWGSRHKKEGKYGVSGD